MARLTKAHVKLQHSTGDELTSAATCKVHKPFAEASKTIAKMVTQSCHCAVTWLDVLH